MNMQKLMDEIAEWSDKTFGTRQRNPAILYHLKKEVPELIQAIKKFQKENELDKAIKNIKNVKSEYADCMMLLLDSAYHFGLTAEKLFLATKEKLEINKKRKWGKPDKNGVVEHVKECK